LSVVYSLISWLMGGEDKPPRPTGNRQPEGGKDKGGGSSYNTQLNLSWDRQIQSPTVGLTDPPLCHRDAE